MFTDIVYIKEYEKRIILQKFLLFKRIWNEIIDPSLMENEFPWHFSTFMKYANHIESALFPQLTEMYLNFLTLFEMKLLVRDDHIFKEDNEESKQIFSDYSQLCLHFIMRYYNWVFDTEYLENTKTLNNLRVDKA